MIIEVPDIDTLRGRRGRKWSRYPADVLPAWIADMDFLPAPAIRAALIEALNSGDLGYGPVGDCSGMPESFAGWAWRRWRWRLDPNAVLVMPDVVGGIANCIEALTEPGDAILVQTPIYPPFLRCVRTGGRQLVTSALAGNRIDFNDVQASIVSRSVRLILLCNPHNPSGRCFTRHELIQLATLALEHDLIVVSDEVHADLVYAGHRHIPFASLGPDAARRTVTLNSASKAFNIAGLRAAVCAAEDARLHRQLRALPPQRWTAFSTLGVRATLTAWSDEGESWLVSCVDHLHKLRDRLSRCLRDTCPGIECNPPEAGYLAWLDCRKLAFDGEPAQYFLDHARVALSPGDEFGEPGRGHARLNFATSESILDQILSRMADACARQRAATVRSPSLKSCTP